MVDWSTISLEGDPIWRCEASWSGADNAEMKSKISACVFVVSLASCSILPATAQTPAETVRAALLGEIAADETAFDAGAVFDDLLRAEVGPLAIAAEDVIERDGHLQGLVG